MDQRREPRFATDELVRVTILGRGERHMEGHVTDASGAGLGLRLGEPVESGAAVRVEARDIMLLGEAVHCRARADGWSVGLRLVHVLYEVGELACLAREIAGEDSGERRRQGADPVQHR